MISILKGLHRRVLGISKDDQVLGSNGFVAGGGRYGSVVMPGSPNTVAVFDDFLGDLVGDEWSYVEGDTGYSGAIVAGTNGIFRITGSETQAVAPTAAAALTGGIIKQWKANQGRGQAAGRLRLSWRGKLEVVSRAAEAGRTHAFIGFSDSGGAEMPAYDTGAGVISNAADLVGFLFSPGGDTGWSLVAAKSTAGDSGDQLVISGKSPSANTYTVLEVEISQGMSDTGSAAVFYVDGVPVGQIKSPVNSATALTPWVGGFIQDTGAAVSIDTDWVNVSAPRDTGE